MTVYLAKLGTPRRRRFAGVERGSRLSQGDPNLSCERVRAAEHAPSDLLRVLERRHGLAEMVERGGVVRDGPVGRRRRRSL